MNHRTAVVGFDIYVIGGHDGDEVSNSCFCFNAVTKKCREISPMHVRRCCLSVAVLRGSVYAMGGEGNYETHRTAERYDCKANQWSWIAPMKIGRENASSAVLNGKIYVAGGRDGQNSLNSVEVYDPDTNRWTFVAPMLSRHDSLSCVEFHGSLYALGGHNGTSYKLSTEKYDPKEGAWTEIPAMNLYEFELNAEVIDDKIFVICDYYDPKYFFHRVASFNDKENRWDKAADMNVCRSGMSTCVIENLPNASDYAYKHREKLMVEKHKEMLKGKCNRPSTHTHSSFF
ncbi:kelch-like protein 10 [Zootermopsis nevadensis]|uniref:kelch-like protein 10 n=1 Tax=Zootermopsis nevadensis TaxID=136037 RepID=UPI000B8E8322|nr:kelch-like protein 10 [Zootermopsis nevadensis]